jgi:hypothetical protein
MRPLISIDRTALYHGGLLDHWGLLDVSLASWGRACACGPAPMACLSGVLTGGGHRGSAAL